MTTKDFIEEIDGTISTFLDSQFRIEVSETDVVPNFDDSNITYPNLVTLIQKCKIIETCVLYVDMRDSSKISASKRPKTLAKIYSSFVYAMIRTGKKFGGHIRNIIGDRVMVVFDRANCFQNAVDTAVLMNTVSQSVMNERVKDIDFKAGIGVDYGKMLVTKTGIVKHFSEKEFYRSLVWLGRPANVASKLTDLAFKFNAAKAIKESLRDAESTRYQWSNRALDQLIGPRPSLRPYLPTIYSNPWTVRPRVYQSKDYPPILMTKEVYEGGSLESQFDRNSGWGNSEPLWYKVEGGVTGYSGEIFGGDVVNVLD